MDLFIKADPENAKAAYAALAQFGAPLQGIRPDDFTNPNIFSVSDAILMLHGKGAFETVMDPGDRLKSDHKISGRQRA